MTDLTERRISLSHDRPRLVADKGSTVDRLMGLARWIVEIPARLSAHLFGPSAQRAFRLLHGHRMEVDVTVSGPPETVFHLYAESRTTLGATELQPGLAQAVRLDEKGRGTATLVVRPKDGKTSGLADLKIRAVRADDPDHVAAQLETLRVAQKGSAQIMMAFTGILLALGFAYQVSDGADPFLAVMILLGLLFMGITAPPFHQTAGFAPWRLWPRAQRVRTGGLLLAGVWIWVMLMSVNYGQDSMFEPYCFEPLGPMTDPEKAKTAEALAACGPGSVLFDNTTAILAAFGMMICVFLALAPAIRPKPLVGRLMILSALLPLFFYDLTLLGAKLSPPGRAAYDGITAYVITKNVTIGYLAFGWMLAGFAFLGFGLRHRLSRGRWFAIAATVLGCILLLFIASGLNPGGYHQLPSSILMSQLLPDASKDFPRLAARVSVDGVWVRAAAPILMVLVPALMLLGRAFWVPRAYRRWRWTLLYTVVGFVVCFQLFFGQAPLHVLFEYGLARAPYPNWPHTFKFASTLGALQWIALAPVTIGVAMVLIEMELIQRRRNRLRETAKQTAPPAPQETDIDDILPPSV